MSFLKSFQISDGTTTTEFVAQESEDILMPKVNPSDPDVTVADKIAELEQQISGGGSDDGMEFVRRQFVDKYTGESYDALIKIKPYPSEPGGYDKNWNLVKTWEQLIADGDVMIENNEISFGEDHSTRFENMPVLALGSDYSTFKRSALQSNTSIKTLFLIDFSSLSNPDGYAFWYSALEDVFCKDWNGEIVPPTFEEIGMSTFSSSKLRHVVLGEYVRLIPYSAFQDCRELRKVEVQGAVTEIQNNAFHGCLNLNSITFADNTSLTKIGTKAFRQCVFKDITIPDSVTSIASDAFDSVYDVTIRYKGTATGFPWGARNATLINT